jgi:hypothetical protein
MGQWQAVVGTYNGLFVSIKGRYFLTEQLLGSQESLGFMKNRWVDREF